MRQPNMRVANSLGAVAVKRPSAPNDITQALASARRGSGTQITMALKPLISPPAKPSPIIPRASVRVSTSLLMANSAQPVAATETRPACTRRGP